VRDLPPGLPSLGPAGAGPIDPCDTVAPGVNGQSLLAPGCVGHDEPSLSFYSNLAGSGGNLTWNATLPVDASPSENQSDLYAAAWFGLVVADPASWFGQCYVEIQLYPDFSWSHPDTSTAGVWSGAAVGWQVDPTDGMVDTCYYQTFSGFSMNQGDSLQLRLLGWPDDPQGERFWLNDTSSGHGARGTLYNSTGNFPLDPAYSANDVENALLWSTGGELPASFAFEIGRSGNPGGVSNSTYGGCTPGSKASSPKDPSVPCPSYDPLSWVNDTLTPWTIGVPVFSNSDTSFVATQMGFSSTVGGTAAIPVLSNGTCGSHIGSAFCTYPWFSYSCTSTGFMFGATDFASETNDFGESDEYPTLPAASFAGVPQYSLGNFSIPSCGVGGHTVTFTTSVTPSGSISFLSGEYSGVATVSGILAGNYSIEAFPSPGAGFADWAVSGSASVASPTSLATTLTVSGDGSVEAEFTTTPLAAEVWFNATLPGAEVTLTPGARYSSLLPTTSVTEGNSLALDPGVYGILAGPPSGDDFLGWSVASGGAGLSIASPNSIATWITVTGATSLASLTATYASAAGTAAVNVTDNGTGTVTLDGTTVPYDTATGISSEVVDVAPGSFEVVARAAPGWRFFQWTFGPAAAMVEFNATTNVTLVAGVASLTAIFAANVTTLSAPGTGGRIALDDVGPLSSGTTSWLPRGTYDLDALPFGNEAFLHWSVSNSSALVVAETGASVTHVTVNSNATVTAVFGVATGVNVTFVNNPSNGGEIRFNYEDISGASTLNSSVADGTYLIRAIPAGTWLFSGWVFSPAANLSLVAGNLVVRNGGGTVTADFSRSNYGISYVSEQSDIFINATIGTHTLSSGQTVNLAPGKYSLTAVPAVDTTFLKWVTTGGIFAANPLKATTTLTVNAAGTLSAIGDGFALTGLSATPPSTEVGVGVSFLATYAGTAPRTFSWTGLPTGCVSANVNPLDCTPTGSGSSSVVVTLAGANGLPVRSSPLAFDVGGALDVTGLSASLSAFDLGMSTTLTTTATGGAVPYSYSYGTLPSGCASANTSELTCTPTLTGSWSPQVTVTDVLGVHGTATARSLVVNPALVVQSLTASLTTVTATVSFVLTTTLAGGTPGYSFAYANLPAGCQSTASSFACVPSAGDVGSYAITVTATDAVGATSTGSVTVQVNPLPSISSFGANPNTVDLNENVTFNVTATGGTGPLAYSYSGLPNGCSGANASKFTCAPVAVGTFEVKVTVTDVFGEKVSDTAVLTVSGSSSTPPSGTGSSSSFPWVLLVVAVVVLAAVVGLVAWWRSRPPASPGTLNPPAAAPTNPPAKAWDEGGQ
jgi:hypothetical protein